MVFRRFQGLSSSRALCLLLTLFTVSPAASANPLWDMTPATGAFLSPRGMQWNSFVTSPDLLTVTHTVRTDIGWKTKIWEENAIRDELTGVAWVRGAPVGGDFYLKAGVPYQYEDSNSLSSPAPLSDISYSASQDLSMAVGDDHHVYVFDDDTQEFSVFLPYLSRKHGAQRIDVDEHGHPWVVTERGYLYTIDPESNDWVMAYGDPSRTYPTKVLDVGAADGKVYVTAGYWENINPVAKKYFIGIFRVLPGGQLDQLDQVPTASPSLSSLWSYYDLDVDRKGFIWFTAVYHGIPLTGRLCFFRPGWMSQPKYYEHLGRQARRGIGAASSY